MWNLQVLSDFTQLMQAYQSIRRKLISTSGAEQDWSLSSNVVDKMSHSCITYLTSYSRVPNKRPGTRIYFPKNASLYGPYLALYVYLKKKKKIFFFFYI